MCTCGEKLVETQRESTLQQQQQQQQRRYANGVITSRMCVIALLLFISVRALDRFVRIIVTLLPRFISQHLSLALLTNANKRRNSSSMAHTPFTMLVCGRDRVETVKCYACMRVMQSVALSASKPKLFACCFSNFQTTENVTTYIALTRTSVFLHLLATLTQQQQQQLEQHVKVVWIPNRFMHLK